MMETQYQFDNAQSYSKEITNFHQKNKYEEQTNVAWRRAEHECVETLLANSEISEEMNHRIYRLAFDLSHTLREQKKSGKTGLVQGLLQEFSLSSQEGIALMCLAEALLRIPDTATRDLLICDKINQGNWKDHLGHSNLIFVNATTWALMLTGKLIAPQKSNHLSGLLTNLLARSCRGIIRKAVDVAIRMIGEQFVIGETIAEALNYAKTLENQGFLHSYDMLGEAALTDHDAECYYKDYTHAIHSIGQASQNNDVYNGAGISIKLSALHPRYERAQIDRVHDELYPKLLNLAILAKQYNIGLNIDAEESERLEISLELLERLCFEPELIHWKGIGFVIQAYQKRCFYVIDYIIDLAKRSQKRLMIRLVKGAYWDSEIKKAQIDGMDDYAVFTRKAHTDLSYIACAKKLIAATEQIYPQFATHNAQTLATIYELADPTQYYVGQYEFQCLHGMGEALYQQVVGDKAQNKLGIPCRIYAPVGNHETLLAYLVRRLLENGANTSFVNRIADKSLKIDDLIENPRKIILASAKNELALGLKHPSIPFPKNLYGKYRRNSMGLDLANDHDLIALNQITQEFSQIQIYVTPLSENLINQHNKNNIIAIHNPANHKDIVGYIKETTTEQVDIALNLAIEIQKIWENTPKHIRALYLNKAADLMESRLLELMTLLSRESGKTYANAISEVREAIDFLRYYAAQIIDLHQDTQIQPLGTVLCISPWNFPLAIFIGQIAAALATGNTVIAKPAEQTPLIASVAVEILWEAGIPKSVIQLLPGHGETVGAQLSNDERIQGIMFTGSTEVARILQKTLAKRMSHSGQSIPLIAETGGQNAMIVDSSALTEQVIIDVLNSAYDSAGQRCSALRILCIQEDSAEDVINMLKGAMLQLRVGHPYLLQTDIGPVIDQDAKDTINNHIEKMRSKGYAIHQLMYNSDQSALAQGTFIPPTLIELPNLNDLEHEVFGPVLHVITYKYGQIEALIDQINAKGYGLTMGLHTRINKTIQTVLEKAEVGNLYINRNIVGAVVGVQPFGGEGLSGTGPKAGGPMYLYRLMQNCSEKKLAKPFATLEATRILNHDRYESFKQWVEVNFPYAKLKLPYNFCAGQRFELQGPTGETNQYMVLPRKYILSLAENELDQIHQLLAIFAVGSTPVVLSNNTFVMKYMQSMPKDIKNAFVMINDIENGEFNAVIQHGTKNQLLKLQCEIANRQGAIIGITHLEPGCYDIPLERFVIERSISINTAAVGGNASLMAME